MFKRLLFAGLVGAAPLVTLRLLFFILHDVLDKTHLGISNTVFFFIIATGIIAGIYTFIKVKPKNTLVEDIIVNQVKIMKAKQEAKLKELQGED